MILLFSHPNRDAVRTADMWQAMLLLFACPSREAVIQNWGYVYKDLWCMRNIIRQLLVQSGRLLNALPRDPSHHSGAAAAAVRGGRLSSAFHWLHHVALSPGSVVRQQHDARFLVDVVGLTRYASQAAGSHEIIRQQNCG